MKKLDPRNTVESFMMRRVNEHFRFRHRISPTNGRNYDKALLKDAIKELRNYRNWLDWLEKNRQPIPFSDQNATQLPLFKSH